MPEQSPLTEAGQARRNAIRDALAERVPVEAARRRRRRTAMRVAGVSAVIVVGAGAWWWGSAQPTPTQAPTPHGPIALAPAEPAVQIVRVSTEQGITARLKVAPPARVDRIDDAELLAFLADSGSPDGLIQTPEGVFLSSELTAPEPTPESGSGA